LNIGSFASLAPVGPIRFEPTSISLQTTPSMKNNNTFKTSNAFIKVSKSNQMNITGAQNVAKIKMIMPTKKITQRSVGNNYKNISINEKTLNMNMVNVLTPTNTPVRINPSTKTGNLIMQTYIFFFLKIFKFKLLNVSLIYDLQYYINSIYIIYLYKWNSIIQYYIFYCTQMITKYNYKLLLKLKQKFF
jgi:hypothetical protein